MPQAAPPLSVEGGCCGRAARGLVLLQLGDETLARLVRVGVGVGGWGLGLGLGLGLGSELGLSLGFGFGFGLEFRSLPEASAGEKPIASAGSGACLSGAGMVVGVS